MNNSLFNTTFANYDFGLSSIEEERATRLNNECLLVDMVCQHPGGKNIFNEFPNEEIEVATLGKEKWEKYYACQDLPYNLALQNNSTVVEEWWKLSGITAASVGIEVGDTKAEAFKARIGKWISNLDWLRFAKVAEDFRQAKSEGAVAFFGNCQPTYGIPYDLNAVTRAFEQGLRVLMLTYNRMDYVGAGCTERIDNGISRYGVQVIELCNKLGVIVDTSHCGYRTTLDACKFSDAPVLANHTCAAGLYDHSRCKSDEELEAIAGTGGVIGVVTVPFFLSGKSEPTIEDMLDHIDYIVEKVGYEYVGIGTDWPLQAPHDVLVETLGTILPEIGFRPEDNIDVTQTIDGFRDYRDFPNIARGLVKRGYTDKEIAGILGENFIRVFEGVCG